MKKRLIIFDMDGTLIDSSITIANAINFVRKNLRLPPLDNKIIISKVNDSTINASRFFYEADHFKPIHQEWFNQYYSENHQKELRLYDGILELLKWLKSKSCLLAIATNAYSSSTLQSLKYLKIESFFDSIVSYDDVSRGKPAPDMIFKILEDLKVSSKDAIFVGDGERDETSAKLANIDFILVDWGFSHNPKALKRVSQLKEHLKKYYC